MGLIRDLKRKIHNLTYFLTIAMMEFMKILGYDMILGKPFLRESTMIHNRENNNVYVQKEDQTLHMDLATRNLLTTWTPTKRKI